MDILKVLEEVNKTIGCRTLVTFDLVETPFKHLRIRLRTQDLEIDPFGFEDMVPMRDIENSNAIDEVLYRVNRSAHYLRRHMASQGVSFREPPAHEGWPVLPPSTVPDPCAPFAREVT